MGSLLSRLRLSVVALKSLAATYEELSRRLQIVAGLPVPNPSRPYWTIPLAPIARHGEHDTPPHEADIVIIGSGITGTSFARALLDSEKESPDRVVMIDARDVCSGATARNGGHITPPLFHDFEELKKRVGLDSAKQIIRFRLAHLNELLQVSQEEGLEADSQAREVQTYDVYFRRELFESERRKLDGYLADLASERDFWSTLDDTKELEKLALSETAYGVISTKAGALHPYRLVTGVLSRLLRTYPDQFQIFSHTPCTSVTPPARQGDWYTVHTPKGSIHTSHVVHATNGWTSHLLERMRGKIVPIRGNMTAQRPGKTLAKTSTGSDDWTGSRSFIFYTSPTDERYDYLTQQLPSSSPQVSKSKYPPPSGELMFGGGFLQGGVCDSAFFEEVGSVDDSVWNPRVISYLSGALSPSHFSPTYWGAEGRPSENEHASELFADGRVKMVWSGIIGISADGMPWVGRVPEKITGRSAPKTASDHPDASSSQESFVMPDTGATVRAHTPPPSSAGLASPGEWIAAGYSGEGMVHAWMCGKALAYMVLGKDTEDGGVGGVLTDCTRESVLDGMRPDNLRRWFPDAFRISEERWKKANIEDWL